jgi:cobalt-precorrin-5B (C1)-methyltransferase
MGDFVGGLLKYVRAHPVERLTIAGGFAKMAKLAQGAMDLHSARGTADFGMLAGMLGALGADAGLVAAAREANTAAAVLALAGPFPLADAVAAQARARAQAMVGKRPRVDVLVVDRQGKIVGRSG